MEGVHEDVGAAIREARVLSNGYGSGPLILYGQSLGGALLLYTYTVGTLDDRHAIAIVIVDSAFSSYQALAREKLAQSWVTCVLQPLAYTLFSDVLAAANHPGSTPRIAEDGRLSIAIIHARGQSTNVSSRA
jgi:hypothetical protein